MNLLSFKSKLIAVKCSINKGTFTEVQFEANEKCISAYQACPAVLRGQLNDVEGSISWLNSPGPLDHKTCPMWLLLSLPPSPAGIHFIYCLFCL